MYTVSANGHVLTEKAFLIAVCNASPVWQQRLYSPARVDYRRRTRHNIIHAGNPLDTAMVGMDLFTGYINQNTPDTFVPRTGSRNLPSADGSGSSRRRTADNRRHDGNKMSSRRIADFPPEQEVVFRPLITPIENAARDIACSVTRLLTGNKHLKSANSSGKCAFLIFCRIFCICGEKKL